MPKEIRHRYAINFDLTIEKLREFYSDTNPKSAYSKIKNFMEKHGFTHRQWSGYISNEAITKSELVDFTMELHQTFSWLINCEGSMDATVITDIFDIKQMILDVMADESNEDDMEL